MDSSGFGVLILCGGKSSRMGTPKAFLEVGGEPLLERVITVAKEISESVSLVAPDPAPYEKYGLPVIASERPGLGPLEALRAALEAAPRDKNFVLACDLPALEAAPLLKLKEFLAPEVDAVVPQSERGLEPLCALYRRRCGRYFALQLDGGESALHVAVERLRVAHPSAKEVGAPPGFFENLNTPEDVARSTH